MSVLLGLLHRSRTWSAEAFISFLGDSDTTTLGEDLLKKMIFELRPEGRSSQPGGGKDFSRSRTQHLQRPRGQRDAYTRSRIEEAHHS